MDEFEFRLTPDGIAHVVRKNYITALCGAQTRFPAPEQGVPCKRCLGFAADQTLSAA